MKGGPAVAAGSGADGRDAAGSGGVRIGVLALQGDVREHRAVLERLGADVTLVRSPAELAAVDGLVMPGGESSTMWRLAKLTGLVTDEPAAVGASSPHGPLPDAVRNGMPVLGTCAGLIMLAATITDAAPGQRGLGLLDVTVHRNAFGSQLDSFETDLLMPAVDDEPVRVAFIRAPIVEAAGEDVEVLGKLPDGRIVAVQQGHVIGCSFHPELTGNDGLHRYFLDAVRGTAGAARVA
ncbi:pyridoxal 5'-phosphate synthase glutaminase subunit PdxT [Spelaeicoccus albus]|uniref:Pyridoxal 5'-phosphate synthase subunit PdxT n=1 Tax=Spelaeicoccus albus TaxID=1280376 RepID=A0A7Z0AAB3_9MICO|nr:5'-phosphate synthase pdxT subunit [Spelaeicoccus albus]